MSKILLNKLNKLVKANNEFNKFNIFYTLVDILKKEQGSNKKEFIRLLRDDEYIAIHKYIEVFKENRYLNHILDSLEGFTWIKLYMGIGDTYCLTVKIKSSIDTYNDSLLTLINTNYWEASSKYCQAYSDNAQLKFNLDNPKPKSKAKAKKSTACNYGYYVDSCGNERIITIKVKV